MRYLEGQRKSPDNTNMAWNAKFRCPLCSQCGADKFSQVPTFSLLRPALLHNLRGGRLSVNSIPISLICSANTEQPLEQIVSALALLRTKLKTLVWKQMLERISRLVSDPHDFIVLLPVTCSVSKENQ